jgi:hypothetical protein
LGLLIVARIRQKEEEVMARVENIIGSSFTPSFGQKCGLERLRIIT